jgi:hypothetical protein
VIHLRQQLSHASLLQDVSAATPIRGRIDAIVTPAARPASDLQYVINLSATLSVPLVVLCSKQAQPHQVVRRVQNTFGARALVVEIPENYRLPLDPARTSDAEFRYASGGRSSDLSVKRNLGIVLGRLRGLHKILFIDDDISQLRPQDVERLAGHLDRHPVASMLSRYFPDNSVVCHARRLAGFSQDIFVSGAVLGVNLRYPELSFFPDIYNEDWFFFARHAAERALPKVGEVRQTSYEPFADPRRAAQEEFGDLLAEGMYALFDANPEWSFKEQLRVATRPNHWVDFRESRIELITETRDALRRSEDAAQSVTFDALNSLDAAERQARSFSPELCVEFLEQWLADQERWGRLLRHLEILPEPEALAALGLTTWTTCGYGMAPAPHHGIDFDLEGPTLVT